MIQHLGQFHPSNYDPIAMGMEFKFWLQSHKVAAREPQIGVRTATDTRNACINTPVLMEWHRDGAGPDPTCKDVTPSVKKLLVWSNGTPTGVKPEDGPEVVMQPYDVFIFDNINMWHRCPPPEENRWFIGISDPIISTT